MNPRQIIGLSIAAVTALAMSLGCSSAPPYTKPSIDVDIPSHWSAPSLEGADTTGERTWWKSFQDPALDRLVEEALTNNYDIRLAASRLEAAAAIARASGALLVPGANLSFDASRRKQNLIGIPIPGFPEVISTRVNSFGVSLDVAWEIDLWGKIRSEKSAALADLEASFADLAAARLSIAAQTAKAYFALLEAAMQVQLAERTVENYELSAEQVRKRYVRGLKTPLDYRLARGNLAGAKALLEARRTQLDQARRQLEILLGRYPAGVIQPSDSMPALRGSVPAGLPGELLLRRPDLLAAERRLAAAGRRVSASKRAFFPSITLTGSGGTLSTELADLVDGDFSVWTIAARILQPIFQGGRLRAEVARTRSLEEQSLFLYAQAALRALGEVESALFNESSLARQAEATKDAARESEAARRIAERQYREGLVDYITVLEAQRRSLDARSQYITVRRQRLDARVNLHLALGGGFELGKEWRTFLESIEEGGEEASER